jgi:hypothetical protein
MLIAIATINNLEVHQMDIKIAFLNCDLDEEVYIEQLEGFVVNRQKKKFISLSNHYMN